MHEIFGGSCYVKPSSTLSLWQKLLLPLARVGMLGDIPGEGPSYSPPREELTPTQIQSRVEAAERKRICRQIKRLGGVARGMQRMSMDELQALLKKRIEKGRGFQ